MTPPEAADTLAPMTNRAQPNILIIGLRGAGKSTTGRALADRLSRAFVDLDQRTLAIMNAPTVAQAWREHGEPAFRDAESRALAEVLALSGAVVSLGGGTPTAPGCERMIRDEIGAGRAIVVYLHAEPQLLADRVRHDPPEHRPRLLGLDQAEAEREMELVYARRDPLYRSLATHIIDASAGARSVLDMVARAIE